jgi:hypothetical protein
MFPILVATRRRLFKALIGDNQLMTISDGNQTIKYLDAVAKNTMTNTKFEFLVTDPGGAGAFISASNGFDAACALNAKVCGSNARGKEYDFYKPKITAARVSPGVWTITITSEVGSVIPFLSTSLQFGNPPQPSVITVVKSATEGVYTVSVVDLAGAPIDAGLNNTLMIVSYNIDYINTDWI